MHNVTIHVAARYASLVQSRRLAAVVRKVLTQELPGERASVSAVIAGNVMLRKLNRQFRGRDEPADVLSFAFEDGLRAPESASCQLGEVYVSYPMARAHAAASGRSAEQEVAHLLVHGALHLLGHDHASKAEKARMEAYEDSLLGWSAH